MDPAPRRIRAVYDCMVFLQAAARPAGPAAACLQLAQHSLIELHLSPTILHEIASVLSRPSVRARFPSLTGELIANILTALRDFSTFIEHVPPTLTLPRDPKDEPYLNLAAACTADFLVTRDADLLHLPTSASPEASLLRAHLPNLRILDPAAFLLAVRTGLPSQP